MLVSHTCDIYFKKRYVIVPVPITESTVLLIFFAYVGIIKFI